MYKQITPNDLRELQGWDLSLDFFAAYWIAVYIVFTVVYATIGAVIFWRKSGDRMALFASLTLVTFPAAFNYAELATLPSSWWLPSHSVDFLGSISLPLFFYLFPTGQFVPRWTRWLLVAAILFLMVQGFLPTSLNFRSPVPTLSGVVFLGFICSMPGAQIYRYRYVSNAVQRQQTKWVVFGISVGLGSFLLLVVLTRFFPSLIPQGLLAFLIMDTAFSLALLLFPLSIGMAILHSQLWDIDILINRTLVYGTLTGTLAILYVGLIILLQSLVSAITSQVSPPQPVIVASTLAIAALFQPLRKSIQTIIDRRFYRRKYRARQILQAFSSTLRNEVDLNHLQEELLQIVYETVQPAHVSLWLCEVEASSVPYGSPTHVIEINTRTLGHNDCVGSGATARSRSYSSCS
jgi:hypothetical protein